MGGFSSYRVYLSWDWFVQLTKTHSAYPIFTGVSILLESVLHYGGLVCIIKLTICSASWGYYIIDSASTFWSHCLILLHSLISLAFFIISRQLVSTVQLPLFSIQKACYACVTSVLIQIGHLSCPWWWARKGWPWSCECRGELALWSRRHIAVHAWSYLRIAVFASPGCPACFDILYHHFFSLLLSKGCILKVTLLSCWCCFSLLPGDLPSGHVATRFSRCSSSAGQINDGIVFLSHWQGFWLLWRSIPQSGQCLLLEASSYNGLPLHTKMLLASTQVLGLASKVLSLINLPYLTHAWAVSLPSWGL